MASMIMEVAATWLQAERPAASSQVRGTRPLPGSPRFRGEVCRRAGVAGSGVCGVDVFAHRPVGRLSRTLLGSGSGGQGGSLPGYRTAGIADLDPVIVAGPTFGAGLTMGAVPAAAEQGAFLFGIEVSTTTPTTTPTTTVRNEKQHRPGIPVSRPPI